MKFYYIKSIVKEKTIKKYKLINQVIRNPGLFTKFIC